jgi:hypothetical protein
VAHTHQFFIADAVLVLSLMGPNIRTVGVSVGKARVVVRVFAEQVVTVGLVDSVPTPPPRHLVILRDFPKRHGVLVAPTNPLLDAFVAVSLESVDVLGPHDSSWVVAPPLGLTVKCLEKLEHLHPLFSEARSIK